MQPFLAAFGAFLIGVGLEFYFLNTFASFANSGEKEERKAIKRAKKAAEP